MITLDANIMDYPVSSDTVIVYESQSTYAPIQNFPFNIPTGASLVTHPVENLISKATTHVSNLSFLEVDDELDAKLDAFVAKAYEGAKVKRVNRKVQDED